jgi:uncharacterized protein YacL
MRIQTVEIQTVQIVAGLLAAVAFVIAFISAGVALVSFAFAVIGSVALAWLAYGIAKRVLAHRSQTDITPS